MHAGAGIAALLRGVWAACRGQATVPRSSRRPLPFLAAPYATLPPLLPAAAATFLLVQHIAALGQAVWGQLLRPRVDKALPAPLRRPADVVFWACFTALVVWPLW